MRNDAVTKPIIIAHKGASGYAPENTLRSFRKAFDLGSQMIELDLHETLDGELVCIHDSTVDRTTNGSGEIHTFTYRELKKLDAGGGEHIPLLEDVLKLSLGKLRVNIELKVIGVEKKVIDLVEHYKMLPDVIVSSFLHGTLITMKELSSHIATAILVKDPMNDLVRYAVELKTDAINPQYELVTQQLVKEAHNQGLKVFPWTVNDPQKVRELFTAGVNGVITDFPDMAGKVLGELN